MRRINVFQMKKLVVFIALVIFVISCQEERRGYKPFEYQEASLNVYVIHPKRGLGPGFLVNAYKSKEDIKNNLPYASAKTNNSGVAQFRNTLHTGLFYIDCLVLGDTSYYAMDSVWVTTDTMQTITLKLQKQ